MASAISAVVGGIRIAITAVLSLLLSIFILPLLVFGPHFTPAAAINGFFLRMFALAVMPLSDKFGFATGDLEEYREPPPLHEKCAKGRSKQWLRAPVIRTWFSRLHKQFVAKTFDQAGRWMTDEQLRGLHSDLKSVAEDSLDECPTYGVFCSDFDDVRSALSNRLCTIVYDGNKAVAFTAIVFLPSRDGDQVYVHLGLTMIRKAYRGQRIQTPMMTQCMTLPLVNLGVLGYPLTSIAASPAGVGSVSDQFDNVYPHYDEKAECKPDYHLRIARHILANFRQEFGSAHSAVFDESTFVVRGSNDPSGGGAFQFIKEDGEPVSRYKVNKCNEFCKRVLDLKKGDELFQVAHVHLIRRMLNDKKRRNKMRKLIKQQEKES